MTSMLTFKRLRTGNDSAFLKGCHGNRFRHKDHFCVWVVLACSAPQAAPVRCVQLSRIPGLVKYYFNRPTRPSRWTFLSEAKRKRTTPLPRFREKLSDCFEVLHSQLKTYCLWKKDDLLKAALLGTEISSSEDFSFALCKMVDIR